MNQRHSQHLSDKGFTFCERWHSIHYSVTVPKTRRHSNVSKTGVFQGSWLRTSPVVHWLRIHLPVQRTRVQSLSRRIPHASEQLIPCTTATELRSPRAHTQQQRLSTAKNKLKKKVHDVAQWCHISLVWFLVLGSLDITCPRTMQSLWESRNMDARRTLLQMPGSCAWGSLQPGCWQGQWEDPERMRQRTRSG